MSDILARLRDALAEVESCAGDIESDIDGLDAMAGDIKCRPAVAIINDLAALCGELRDALTLDGKALSAVAAEMISTDTKKEENP